MNLAIRSLPSSLTIYGTYFPLFLFIRVLGYRLNPLMRGNSKQQSPNIYSKTTVLGGFARIQAAVLVERSDAAFSFFSNSTELIRKNWQKRAQDVANSPPNPAARTAGDADRIGSGGPRCQDAPDERTTQARGYCP